MKIEIKDKQDFIILAIDGRIDTLTAGDFEIYVMQEIAKGKPKLIIDCSGLSYISSSGLRVFLMAQKKMLSSGGQLSLCCLQPPIKEIFDISGFSGIFNICEDIGSCQ